MKEYQMDLEYKHFSISITKKEMTAMLTAFVFLKVNLKMENFKDKGNTLTNKMLN